ncbi:ABC transporter permease [Compostibacter hankyongensis]|uniref:ABC transporter permease n=1 Tax=Compostibacter hankyongensis TaxID=1007089 RepID=A0ABP8FXC6_9BACT
MLSNYFKTAWRHLLKGKAYTLINITGLATGMAIALLIGLWIADEISFDHYFARHERIVQGMVVQAVSEGANVNDFVAMPMGQAFRDRYGDLFKRVALSSGRDNCVIAAGEKKLPATALWAQQELPEMFTFKMEKGTISSMADPSTALISASLAEALFGQADPINKTFRLNNKNDLKIGGVYEDLPSNTTFADVRMILPWDNGENRYLNGNTDWNDHNGLLYAELADNVSAAQANARIRKLPTPHIKGWREEAMVYPLDKTHLYDQFSNGRPAGGRILFVWLFGIIGSFVLLLACINFMNLATARSEKRAKEVGIRKTIGSARSGLIGQFLGESVLLSGLASGLALLLTVTSLPFFNTLAAKQITIPWDKALFWVTATGFILLTGLLSGSYPAFYLSGFKPVSVLKGPIRAGRSASRFRQVLVVLQFSISLVLIIGTLIVYRQIGYTKDRPVGYNREGLLSVNINTPQLYDHYDALRRDLLQSGMVQDVAASSMKLTSFMSNNELYWRRKRPDQESVFFRNVNVTRDFGTTVGWKVIHGRDFSREYATDSSAMILNEAAARVIGIKDPIGETMRFGRRNYTVIGVVNDMVTNSPYDSIEPAIFLGDGYVSEILLRIRPGSPVHTALDAIAAVFKKYDPGSPFLYRFTDDEYARKFEAEQRIGDLASLFTGLAIFISCLGLFGLASFVAEQRTKEIGVRKVLGAGIHSIWMLLSKEFIRLVSLSLVIAIPLSYWIMDRWLQQYTYRSGMPWWIFISAGAGILLITLLTVSYQSLKAALQNPVKSLRTE